MLIVKNPDVYAPEPKGRMDLLLGGGRILRVEPGIEIPAKYCRTLDASGLLAVPGFLDAHVHIVGGGGEGGFATRTPELALSSLVRGGVTTVVGCLGTDGVSRTMGNLIAKARALDEEGVSAYVYTGHYEVPVQTLTGSIEGDLLFIDKVLGVGELALSDHRSSQPSFEAFARAAGQARRGGLLSGKAGLVNVHMGDGPRGLELLRRILAETELPASQFLPTHCNRNRRLFDEATAYALAGGCVDLTTSSIPGADDPGEVRPGRGLRLLLEAGVDPARITFTSDGQGSLPRFDADGAIRGLGVGEVTSLFDEIRRAVREEGVALATALRAITTSPADLLRLGTKGRLAAGMDADLVLLEPEGLRIHTVVAKGRIMMEGGRVLRKGAFE